MDSDFFAQCKMDECKPPSHTNSGSTAAQTLVTNCKQYNFFNAR